ncbi:MAG: DUF4845 domain-containing protein [Methylobacterium sp.]|nr:DUF4845 domain-containing protein [Methylobacterium sp.]
MKKQQGFTFWSLSFTVGTIVLIALVAMKLFPPFSEFTMVKKAITNIAADPDFNNMSRTDIQRAFDRSASIDDIQNIHPDELLISKNASGGNVVTAEYQVVVPMVANVSFLLDFFASTDASATPGSGGGLVEDAAEE